MYDVVGPHTSPIITYTVHVHCTHRLANGVVYHENGENSGVYEREDWFLFHSPLLWCSSLQLIKP